MEEKKKTLQAVEAERDELQEQLRGFRIGQALDEAAARHPGLTTTARELLEGRVRNAFTTDRRGVVVPSGQGSHASVQDFVDTLVQEHGGDSSFVSPSGPAPSRSKAPASIGEIRLSAREAKNPRNYQRAKAEAEKQGKALVLEG